MTNDLILICFIFRCYGAMMQTSQGTSSADITILVDKIAAFLSTQTQVIFRNEGLKMA